MSLTTGFRWVAVALLTVGMSTSAAAQDSLTLGSPVDAFSDPGMQQVMKTMASGQAAISIRVDVEPSSSLLD
ncbi:hypothetical protein, partial [Thermomonas sp.]